MNVADNFYQKLENDTSTQYRLLIFKFFLLFMRFEFVLKVRSRNSDSSKAWEYFVSQNQQSYNRLLKSNPDLELNNAVDYITTNPPRALKYENDEFQWKTVQRSEAGLRLLTLLIRAIRNNLFHGNKSIGIDDSRDQELLKSSLIIISNWVTFLDIENDIIEGIFQ